MCFACASIDGLTMTDRAAGAIIQMTRCAALDSAKWGVRVNAVCPGPILTDGTKRHAAMLGVSLEEACADMTSHQIIPRLVQNALDAVAAESYSPL